MKRLLFEDPFWLYVLLVLAELVLLALWRKSRERRAAQRLLIPPGIAALVFALATLVVTDRERITAATHEIIEQVKAGRLDALETRLDDRFQGRVAGTTLDKPRVLERARKALRSFSVREVEIKRMDIEVDGDRATMKLVTAIRMGGRGPRRSFPLLWRLEWIKRGKRWRILEAAEPRIGATW